MGGEHQMIEDDGRKIILKKNLRSASQHMRPDAKATQDAIRQGKESLGSLLMEQENKSKSRFQTVVTNQTGVVDESINKANKDINTLE